MKKAIVLIGIVVVMGIIFYPKDKPKEVLVEDNIDLNSSLAFYIEQDNGTYEESSSIPQTGYTLNTTKSVCTNNTTPIWRNNNLYLSNLESDGTSCYLYFQKLCPTGATTCEAIVANNPTIDDSRSNGITGPLTEDTTGTLFTAEDDYGTSLIFAGDIDNNWVSFAGYYWRIIRINGDGSIRMIYSGEDTGSVTDANRTGETTQIGTSAFNEQSDDNAYVGYMYGTPGSNTYEETHANINDSTIKTVLDNWYQQNLLSYSNYISAEQGFYNDRSLNTTDEIWWDSDTKLGYGIYVTAYAPFSRFMTQNNSYKNIQNPTLKSSQTNDYFTVNGSSRGNHDLDYPIGLITADEVVLAGGFVGRTNNIFYLVTNQYYWTMTPLYISLGGSYANGFNMWSGGAFSMTAVNGEWGIRPVVNLDASISLTGSGTSTDPYTVEGA